MATVILCDDHHIVRQGFRSLLEKQPNLSVIADTGNSLEVPNLVAQLKPDILIVDLMMPGLNGLDITRQIERYSPTTNIIVLTMHADESYVRKALASGAKGYVLKDSKITDLLQAINAVLAGGRYLSPPLSERVLDVYLQNAEETNEDSYERLTNREREIFQLVAEGNTSPQIAERLSISSRTVEVHRSNIMRKLNLYSHTDLIRFAIRQGILNAEI
jgi:DNA-binding NarL/FixJ family response regulator